MAGGEKKTKNSYVLALGAAIALALFFSIGTLYGMTPWATPSQGAYPSGMMGGYGHGSGLQGGSNSYTGGMMGGYGGTMGISSGMMGSHWGTMSHYLNSSGNVPKNGAFVAIVNYDFYPKTLSVSKGTTVTWANMDFVQHTVTSGSEQAPTGLFDSHEFNHMQSFSYTFSAAGTYTYFCDVHPGMTGTIVVTA